MFREFFCCTCLRSKDPLEPNENSRLIPAEEYPPHPGPPNIDYRRITSRLDTIVRSTEGKMVNVTSRVPFNLHNRPQYRDLSRSTSTTHKKRPSPHPSPQPDPDPDEPPIRPTHSRVSLDSTTSSLPPERERSPILNVRLVTPREREEDQSQRGRKLERDTLSDIDVAGSEGDTPRTNHPPLPTPSGSNPSKNRESPSPAFKIKDAGALSMSWGD